MKSQTFTFEERHYMAYMRSRFPLNHRRQYLASWSCYSAFPPSVDEIAQGLVGAAQDYFKCNAKWLVVDRVVGPGSSPSSYTSLPR